ncbi:MAG TPA: ABC transporter permease subunit, partial [Nocardioides sp.]
MLPWTVASIVLVLAVAGTCLVLGTVTGWLLAATDLPGRRALLVLATLPLAVPSYVAAYGWLSLRPGLQGFWPTWAILTAACLPYVVLPVAAALRSADHALVEVARAAGRPPLRALVAGLWPQVVPGAAAGALLAGLYALSDFGTPSLLRHQVLTFAVQRQYGSFVGRERAALLALGLVALALVLVVAERALRGNAERWRRAAGAPRPPRPTVLGRWTLPALALVLLPAIVGAVVPVLALFRRLAL